MMMVMTALLVSLWMMKKVVWVLLVEVVDE
jgi:hypothetical protein